ncbi:NAD(P)H-dependent glycerol-3-phosphate dehydrogenase [Candidatus Amarobacter glycogenicus]|uniref:NAD(P)H-dependent glycerol-3-phosphate dehydrogenase n=1 Tax=Candidatus Amarobacter glycogenicus TaxID=3140699 RepID=UPI003135E23D|nr:NAD(P)-dependent glycerol-3-phosphate dehydrogenase [Dehalococcoidia bacterium]
MAAVPPQAEMSRFAVLGATSWGVTLAWLLHANHNDVVLLTRTSAEADSVREEHGLARLPELHLPRDVHVQPVPAPPGLDGAIIAVPAQALRASVAASGLARDIPVLSAAKGIDHTGGLRMSQVLGELGWPPGLVAAISGPNLAHEIARGLPAAAVVASASKETAEVWQRALAGPAFRIYTSFDLTGVELAGAYKNVIAIAAGAAWGLDFGANTVSTIMTRGLAEMARLGVAFGCDPLTFQGLAGVGDLATTCFSPLSRNRRFGELLAGGRTVDEARTEIGEAIEGIATSGVALELAREAGVELPICAEVAAVVAGEKTVAEAMLSLLARPLRPEAGSAS